MAILTRVKISPQQRYDLEDLFAMQGAARTDAKLWAQKFLSELNLIMGGFTVSGIGLNSATVSMANASLIMPQNTFDFSYFISAPAEPDVVISDADLVDGTRNYIELALTTKDATPLTKAFWDPEANSGNGAEFNQIVNTVTDLAVSFVASTAGFSGSPDRIPIAIIDTDGSGVIKVILDRRELFGRLAKPNDLDNEYAWGTKVDPVYNLVMSAESGTFVAGETITIGGETATVVTGGTTSITFNEPTGINFSNGDSVVGGTSGATGTVNTVLENFLGVDKSLNGQKKINDALMTEIKKIKNTRFWWQDAATSLGGVSSFVNSVIAPFSSGAKVSWSGTVLSITDSNGSPLDADVVAKIRLFGHNQQLNLTREDGTGGSSTIAISDGQVLYVELPTSGDRTYSGSGVGATNFKTVAFASFTPNDTNYWLAYRIGSKLLFRGNGELQAGEDAEIGDNVPASLLSNLGLVDEVTAPAYSSDIRGTASQSIVAREGVLTDAVGDEQEDRSGYLRSDDEIVWSGSQLSFTSDIILELINTKSGTLTQHTVLVAGSPISLANNESAYVLINRTSASETVSVVLSGTTPIPAQTQANKDVFVLFRRKDVAGTGYLHIPFHKQVLNPGQTVRLGASGSGSGSGSGVGSDLNSLSFQAEFIDSFEESPTAATSAVNSSLTNATYNAAKKLYRLNYDATKTVTGTGASMTLSGAPSFTIAPGDVLIVDGVARRIVTTPTQTTPTIESAFPTDPSAASCTVSQAVHTTDVVAHTENSTGNPINADFPGVNLDEFLLKYSDSSAVGDDIPDFPGAALVAYSASADNTNWSDVFSRVANQSDSEQTYAAPISGTSFRLRFFAAAISGSGAVNILDYTVKLYRDEAAQAGEALDQAYGFLDGVGTPVNSSLSLVGGKTRITFDWHYPVGINPGEPNGALVGRIDGVKIPRFIDATNTPDSYYKEISSNVVELDDDYSAFNLSYEFVRPVPVIDSADQNSTDIAYAQEVFKEGFQDFVKQNFIDAPYTEVINRAQIPDLAADLRANMGIDRIPVFNLIRKNEETDALGQPVFGVADDDRNLMRFVGDWAFIADFSIGAPSTSGSYAYVVNATTTAFAEFIFYGTGLNLLAYTDNTSRDWRITVDAGSEGSNAYVQTTAVFQGRSYTPNTIINAVSGLALGIHRVKVRNVSGLAFYGIEVLNEASTIEVNPGVGYSKLRRNENLSLTSVSANSSFDSIVKDGVSSLSLGTKGARVIAYLNSDGTIGKSAVAADTTQLNGDSADHSHEEVIRDFHFREFGNGDASGGLFDFAGLTGAGAVNRKWTLDDNTTTLVGKGVTTVGASIPPDAFGWGGVGSGIRLSFVGTGIDITRFSAGGGTIDTYEYYIDGTLVQTDTTSPQILSPRKIVSGLKYCSHVLQILRTTNVDNTLFMEKFTVYGPKKPVIPDNAVEIADYYAMGDFVANSTADVGYISEGTLRKFCNREVLLVEGTGGTESWNQTEDVSDFIDGYNLRTDRSGAYVECTFLGTGFDFRYLVFTNADSTAVVSVDGLTLTSTNFPGVSTSAYGGSFTFSTGVLNMNGSQINGSGLVVTGLDYGKHTVRITTGSAAYLYPTVFDVITPIHAYKLNRVFQTQDTALIGSQGLGDSRKFTPVKNDISKPKQVSTVTGYLASTTTTSTSPLPMIDMEVTLTLEKDANVLIIGQSPITNSNAGANNFIQIGIDGYLVGWESFMNAGTASSNKTLPISLTKRLAKGTHRIQLYWWVSAGTATSESRRVLNVVEL